MDGWVAKWMDWNVYLLKNTKNKKQQKQKINFIIMSSASKWKTFILHAQMQIKLSLYEYWLPQWCNRDQRLYTKSWKYSNYYIWGIKINKTKKKKKKEIKNIPSC